MDGTPLLPSQPEPETEGIHMAPKSPGPQGPLAVIGTGTYGVALAKRLHLAGFHVILGSRRPERRGAILSQVQGCTCGLELAPLRDCFLRCRILFLAVHVENFKLLLQEFSVLARDKVVVDVSNRDFRYARRSNSEVLASVLPEARLVKAFNTVPAAVLDRFPGAEDNRKVLVASDDPSAKRDVSGLAHAMGFSPIDFGGLKRARFLEDMVLRRFSHWGIPALVAVAVFVLWSLYIAYVYFVQTTAFQAPQLFLKVPNKPICMTAITMLALTYLPGQLAAVVQVYRGTKHQPFPRFLDTWLKSRKQFGLVAFFLVCFHAMASGVMLSPTYYRSWFQKQTVTLPANASLADLTSDLRLEVSTGWMVWKGEAALLTGIAALLVMGLVALTSVPSIGNSLNWAEWRCMHTKMASLLLVLSVLHVLMMATPSWAKNPFSKTVRGITFLSLILPVVVLIFKLLFFLPPLRGQLRKIRRGWERGGDTLGSGSTQRPGKQKCCSGARVQSGAFNGNAALGSKTKQAGAGAERACLCCDHPGGGQGGNMAGERTNSSGLCDCSAV